MKKARGFKLYDIIFPIWFFYVMPTYVWLYLVPANLVVDGIVLYVALRVLGFADRRKLWLRSILPMWLFGLLADFLGGLLTGALTICIGFWFPQANVVMFPMCCLLALPGIALAGALVYWLNRRFTLRRAVPDAQQLHRLCLALAVFTAPYTMLIPVYG